MTAVNGTPRSSELLEIPCADFPDVDAVVHLAGRPGVRTSWGEYDSYLRDNAVTTERLLKAYSAKRNRPRIILASSSSVYGPTSSVRSDFPASAQLRPASPYGASKVAAEAIAAVYAQRDFAITVLRFFTVYGPGQRHDMAIGRMIAAAETGCTFEILGTGQQIRHFTYVGDTVDAVLAAIRHSPSDGLEIFDVASPHRSSVLDCVEVVQEVVGREVPSLDFSTSSRGSRVHGAITRLDARSLAVVRPHRIGGGHPSTGKLNRGVQESGSTKGHTGLTRDC